MPLFFLGTREWRNRQTRTVQVRVPVMEWGFNSPLAHDETADPFGICGFCFPWLLLVAPLVFRAPSGPAAVCAGGRRPAREPSAPRASLGASPRSPARPRRRPPAPRQIPPAPFTPAAPALLVRRLARRLEARPGPATAHGCRSQALRTLRCPPHQWGRVADVWLGASSRSPARPRRRLRRRSLAPCLEAFPILSFACNSLTPAVRHSVKSPEFQRLHFKA